MKPIRSLALALAALTVPVPIAAHAVAGQTTGTTTTSSARDGSTTAGTAYPGVRPAKHVSMEAVVKAAQIDPQRRDHTYTKGARRSVLAVEKALHHKHLLRTRWVDGYFGTKTVAAYAKYQKSLGYHGIDASGLPGVTSLTTLGKGRYTVRHTLNPGDRVTSHGATMNERTQAMLTRAEHLLGRRLTVTQGSYNPGGDPTSAGTHDGGGVLDLSVHGMSDRTKRHVVKVLRTVGFAAWWRKPYQGDWPDHIHAAAISDTDLSAAAQHQIGAYYLGLDGLADDGPDDGPRVKPIRTWEEYQRAH